MIAPLLSIVTGTYNRLPSLRRMIGSARDQLPRGLAREFVVVDGGSTDGTQDWCKAQPDIRLIEHGELRGAIRAFCDGARAASGEYVVLANDDIVFKPFGLLAAIAHLERTPDCGAVAFADNRTSLVNGDGSNYRVEGVGATTADGRAVMVVYAQVGMFRKWLGDQVGWWGDQDPIMGHARTYGGDNYLSARIWEAGYTVDPVPQAVIEDLIARDGLREANANRGATDSALYYQRFPTVHIPAQLAQAPATERLRILCLPIYEPAFPGRLNREAGLTEALADYGLALEWDYINEPVDLVQLVAAWKPDLLITQIQGPSRQLTPYVLASMRNAVPEMLIVNWNGDVHERGLLGDDVLEMLRYVDLQTTVNAKVLPEYATRGIRAAYWQIGYKDPAGALPQMPAYEVLFMGNCYNRERQLLINALRSTRIDDRPVLVGLYGNCPGADGNTHYDFAAQRALLQQATIVIGDTYAGGYAFVSNRVFQALAAGAFLLQQHSEGLKEFTGLTPNVHFAEWRDTANLKREIIRWLKPENAERRAQIAAQGRDYVRANFSYSAQARKLFNDLLPQIAEVERAAV